MHFSRSIRNLIIFWKFNSNCFVFNRYHSTNCLIFSEFVRHYNTITISSLFWKLKSIKLSSKKSIINFPTKHFFFCFLVVELNKQNVVRGFWRVFSISFCKWICCIEQRKRFLGKPKENIKAKENYFENNFDCHRNYAM